ncbi:MAG: response regulator, partial [Pseudomonadota bacterium]
MKQIVIADDSATARMFIKQCLEIAGCREATFVEVENGKDALAALREHHTDLVVADLNMPVMDGETLLKWIKSSPRLNSIPVLVITSALNPAKEKELMDLGAHTVLSKPVSPARLSPVIGPLLKAEKESQKTFVIPNIKRLQEIMAAASIETFENMAFMEVVQTDQDALLSEESDTLKASILVHDPFTAEFRLALPRELVAAIAETLYPSGDSPNTDQTLFDVLSELLNTIAGRVLSETVPGEHTFRIGLPQTSIEPFK